jgi:putative ABC transport system permease protein
MIAMLFRILKRDVTRNRIINLVICLLVAVSAFLLSSGAGLIVQLKTSLDALFEQSVVPHLVQMHAGDLDRDQVATWAAGNPLVDQFQIVQMISVDGSDTGRLGRHRGYRSNGHQFRGPERTVRLPA